MLLIAAWLGRALLSNILARDLERLKAVFKAQGDLQIEQAKLSHQLLAIEHEARLTPLAEKRVEVFAEIYRLLVAMHNAAVILSLFTIGERREMQEGEAFKRLDDARVQLQLYYDINRIYLPKGLCEKLDAFVIRMYEESRAIVKVGPRPLFSIMSGGTLQGPSAHAEAWQKENGGAWDKANAFFDVEIPLVRQELESAMRSLLGDENRKA